MAAMSLLLSVVVLLSQVATQVSAFAEIFPSPLQGAAFRHYSAPVKTAAQTAAWPQPVALRGNDVVAVEEIAAPTQDGPSSLRSAAFAGALAIACLGAGSLRRMMSGTRASATMRSRTTMYAPTRTIIPGPRNVKEGVEGAEPRGASYVPWLNLRRQARKGLRYWKQRQILAESGITQCKGGWKKWMPNRETHNFYHGPKSHPDNPWFPAPSPGYDKAPIGPIPPKWRAVPVQQESGLSLFSSQPTAASSSTFVAGRTASASMKRFGLGSSCTRQALVAMKAHKKAASSTKNQGHKNNAKHYGIRPTGITGQRVKSGQVLLKQKGYTWHPGPNVVKGKDYTLNSLKEGVVMWRGAKDPLKFAELGIKPGTGHEIFVVPYQFIEEKCDRLGEKNEFHNLAPKKYAPWMRPSKHQSEIVRNKLAEMREEWLQSEEGKEALTKKEEKKKKQKEFNNKIWAKIKAKNVAQMKRAGTYAPREAVKS